MRSGTPAFSWAADPKALIRAHEAGVKRLMKKDDSEKGVPITLFAQSDSTTFRAFAVTASPRRALSLRGAGFQHC